MTLIYPFFSLTLSQVRCLFIGILIGYFVQYSLDSSSLFSSLSSTTSLLRSATVRDESTTNKWSKLTSPAVKVTVPPLIHLTKLQLKALSIAKNDPLQQNEIILALTTKGPVEEQLEMYIHRLQQLGIDQRLLLIVFDNEFVQKNDGICNRQRIHCFFHQPFEYPWAKERSFREVVSAMKFYFLSEILKTGINVLLSDTDIVYLDNPFCWLHRDSDIEGQTDGANPKQSYGYYEVIDDLPLPPPFRYSIYFLNSGFFYIRSSETTVTMMIAIADRLAVTNMWDQAAFNDEVWSPRTENNYVFSSAGLTTEHELYLLQELFGINKHYSTDKEEFGAKVPSEYRETTIKILSETNIFEKLLWLRHYRQRTRIGGRQPTVRVMNHLRFTNSKVAIHNYNDNFGKEKAGSLCPVIVHINYHVEKVELMTKVKEEYFRNCVIQIRRDRCGILPNTTPIPYVMNTGGTGGVYSDKIVSQREIFYKGLRREQRNSLFSTVQESASSESSSTAQSSITPPESFESSFPDFGQMDLAKSSSYSFALQDVMRQLYVSGIPEMHRNDSYRTVILPHFKDLFDQTLNELSVRTMISTGVSNNIPIPDALLVPWD